MKKSRKYSIRKIYFLLTSVGAFILLGIFSYIWVQNQNEFLEYQITQFEKIIC